MGLPITSLIHGRGVCGHWALVCVVPEYAVAAMAGTLFHIPTVCVYISIYIYIHLYIYPYIYAQRYMPIFKYIYSGPYLLGLHWVFRSRSQICYKPKWQRKQGVVKCQPDNVVWLIWLLEVSLCCLSSGRGTGAKQEFVGAVKSRAVRWAHMVTQPGLMP